MRFPDLQDVVAVALATLRRYPATLLSAAVACGISLALIDSPGDPEALVRALLAAILGIALMFSIESALGGSDAEEGAEAPESDESSGLRHRGRRFRWPAAIVAALGLIAFALLSNGWSEPHLFERFAQLLLAFHLVAAFAAFIGTQEENGFWQFNRSLFMRFWTATLFTGVLFAGLAVALVSIEALFNVDIDEENYARLFVFMALLVHPWMFLAGIPRDVDPLEQERSYPQALKVFAQFILVPLVTVYLAILTAYLVRVVMTQEWPSGWIGWLVSSVSVVGTLALLLVHPVREDEGNGWVRGYARWFWVALMPSIVMLFFAIGKRISQYGFTERRYFLLVLAIWIAVVAVWFAFTRSRRIRFIPVSLAVVALVGFVGPWGAYSVSERSQVRRLTSVLESAGATSFPVAPGTALTADNETARQVSDILRYLLGTHSVASASSVVELPAGSDSLDVFGSRYARTALARETAEALGMRYYEPWESPTNEWINIYAEVEVWPAPTEIYQHTFRTYLGPEGVAEFDVAGQMVSVVFDTVTTVVRIEVDSAAVVSLPLAGLLAEAQPGDLTNSTRWDAERLVVTGISDQARARLHLRNLHGRREGAVLQWLSGEADVFLTLSDPRLE